MASMRRFGPLDIGLLFLVLAVAAGARVGYLMTCTDTARNAGPLRVQDAHLPIPDLKVPSEMRGAPRPSEMDALIYNVSESQSFSCLAPFSIQEEATAHVAPGYPYLAGLARMGVSDDEELDVALRWAQVVLGSLTAGCYYLFARRAFRNLVVATLAGFFTALHPFWIINVAAIDDGVLASFMLAFSLLWASQAGEKGGALSCLLLGLSLAGLSLVRAAFLPFAFVTLIWFLIRSRSLTQGWLCALCSFLGFAIGVSPWTVRNVQEFEEPVPIVSSAYLHLWVGNNPEANGGPATDKMWARLSSEKLRLIKEQPKRYATLGEDVLEEVEDNPELTIRRRAMATMRFFVGQRWLADGTLAEKIPDAEEMPEWLADAYPIALPATLFGMFVLAFLGWRWSYGWRWESVPAALAVIWVPIPFILSHAETLSGPRLPLDGVFLCYAAFALVCLIPGLNGALLEGAVEEG